MGSTDIGTTQTARTMPLLAPDDAPVTGSVRRVEQFRRVLFIIDLKPTKFGSVEEQLFILARTARTRGSLFVPMFAAPPMADHKAAYDQAHLPVLHMDLNSFSFAKSYELLKIIGRFKIEVVHWNLYCPINSYLLLIYTLKPHVRHVFTDHVSRESGHPLRQGKMKRSIKKLLLKPYSAVGGVSRFVVKDLELQRCWRNVFQHYHFINTERFRPDELLRSAMRRDLLISDNVVVLVVAHLIQEKGVDVALRALSLLPRHIIMWIVGDGKERAALEQLAQTLGVSGRVVFWGLQQRVEPYMQSADCYICPSIWQEAAGLVNLEALSCGLPVIASDVGGIPEFIDDGKTGFLFPAGDHQALADKIRWLASNAKPRDLMSEQARCTAVQRFSVEQNIEELFSVYAADPPR